MSARNNGRDSSRPVYSNGRALSPRANGANQNQNTQRSLIKHDGQNKQTTITRMTKQEILKREMAKQERIDEMAYKNAGWWSTLNLRWMNPGMKQALERERAIVAISEGGSGVGIIVIII
jgi:hypothetical protein